MRKQLIARRALLFLAAAVLSAVVADVVIESAANAGFYGPAFADHDQRSLLATATGGLVLALAAAVVVLLEHCRSRGGGDAAHWLSEAAHDISSRWSWSAFPSTLATAIAVRYAMESAELLRTTGHVATGLGWLGGPLLVALLIHAAFCGLMLLALMIAMRSIVRAFDAVLELVALLAAIIMPPALRAASFASRDAGRGLVNHQSPLATHTGERGPPLTLLAT